MDLLLDKDTNDIVFINGQCPMTHSDYDTVGQRLKIRLLTFQGEWIFDITYGIPYLQQILGRKKRKQDVDQIFRQKILEEDGVVQIKSFDSTLSDRNYSAKFIVVDSKGNLSPDININVII